MAKASGATAEELLSYMELMAGRRLRSHVAIQRYLDDIGATAPHGLIARRNRRIRQQAVLLFVLLAAVLQFYFVDVYTQIYSIRGVTFFVPVQPGPAKTKAMLNASSAEA